MSVNDHMASMGQSMMTAYEVFMARSWGLIKFERRTLLIPDHPVTLVRADDRRAAIIMASPGHDDFFVRTHTKLAKELNQRLADNARRELFHHPHDNPLDGVDLPPMRDREMMISQSPKGFLMPHDGRVT